MEDEYSWEGIRLGGSATIVLLLDLVDVVFITHVLLCLSMSPSVNHRGWSPGLLVPQSKHRVCPSPLSVHRHSTSLLDLYLAINHRLRAPHLHITSQETCCTTQLTPWLVHRLNPRHKSRWQSLITTEPQGHILALCSYFFCRCLLPSIVTTKWHPLLQRIYALLKVYICVGKVYTNALLCVARSGVARVYCNTYICVGNTYKYTLQLCNGYWRLWQRLYMFILAANECFL
jgi:hypothetical protein